MLEGGGGEILNLFSSIKEFNHVRHQATEYKD